MAGPTVSDILADYSSTSPPARSAGAAVLAVLREGREDVETLLIERATRDDDPASGQVSLPGGHVDPADPDLRATALRELEEEVGLRRADLVEPIRYVDTVFSQRFSLSVGVFAAPLAAAAASPAQSSPREVASVFWLPRRALDRRVPIERESPRGTLSIPSVRHDGHIVWGFTLRVLDGLFRGGNAAGPAPPAPRTGPARARGSGAGARRSRATIRRSSGRPARRRR
ncbi:MAG TPA: CoA pyrophosphatase [Thermoplasmata archaeon]|nr:CoA pyrophosphatase [Thermoplasmata archaeon]